jgi:superfamily II DNA or RNA helicase/HKD family nuclease
MPSLPRGLYEELVTEALEARLQTVSAQLHTRRRPLHEAEAADRISLHLSRETRRALDCLKDKDRITEGITLARKILDLVETAIPDSEARFQRPINAADPVLDALLALQPDGTPETIPAPLTPLLDTTLLTNAPHEPRVGHQILTEIYSADRIDVVMAFIRRSGIRPMIAALKKHCESGQRLRVLTTTYTGSTEERALDELQQLGAEVFVSYDLTTTRLHAKAWLFHRDAGFSTAYIGSSNLTHSAQISGLEWNVRVSGARNPDVIRQVTAMFEAYRNSGDFLPYDRDQFRACAVAANSGPEVMLSPLQIRLEPFQERLLELIALSRQQGHHRNLLVSATGTGKTVMAAVDYGRLAKTLQRSRLLFVAHREEILTQTLGTFRHGLRDAAFGELWVGGNRPNRFDHVFASIQSLNASGFANLDPKHFDVVIVDEFHHAEAPSYRTLLDHVKPRELLGLTATPERSDGLPVLHWFDDRIAAELRVWDAIDQQYLSPFVYYGIHDGLDLREVPWRRGQGYDAEGLSKLLTANDAWAKQVIARLIERVEDIRTMRTLGFCVTIAHARFMERVFKDAGIPSKAVWADTPDDERRAALTDLATRKVNVVFSVDLFNEGVDVPVVDTLLLLRPTDSPTLFLQQLGRGLRRSEGKTACTVLDFVGHHRKEFRFDRRFGALLGGTRKELEQRIREGFPYLPAGCHMELDPVASEIVLRSIREAVPSTWPAKVAELRRIAQGRESVSLAQYLEETGSDLDDVYSNGRAWSDLRAAAGLPQQAPGPEERNLRRACGRLLHIDDMERINAYRGLLTGDVPPKPEGMAARDRRLLRMLVASLTTKVKPRDMALADAAALLWSHSQIRSELTELLEVLATRINHLVQPLTTHPDIPLQVHARYTRAEIMAAFVPGNTARAHPWREGVHWAKDERTDLFAFTLDKTSGHFSPTTRYRDYAISRDLIHWESQSTTRAASKTGLRYQSHVALGTSVMIFARYRTDDRAFWFLGPATYVSHQGDRPMAVTWRLQHELPGDLFESFAAAVA